MQQRCHACLPRRGSTPPTSCRYEPPDAGERSKRMRLASSWQIVECACKHTHTLAGLTEAGRPAVAILAAEIVESN